MEMIAHIQVIQHCNQREATEDAREALYDGRVESRFRGSDPLDRIEPNSWARANFFRDGLVSFSGPLAGVPAPGWEPRRFSIEVKREHVMREWPSQSSHDNDTLSSTVSETTYTTGAPGRRTSRHLVEPEAKRRIAAGDIPKSLAEFARSLSGWLSENHPTAAPMTEKTIENRLRQLWRERPPK
jgi:hypothetical protein